MISRVIISIKYLNLAHQRGLGCADPTSVVAVQLYYRCDTAGHCTNANVDAPFQVLNPISRLPVNNNGTLIALPALPDLGAGVARGRLVLGIGTQSNNQLPASAKVMAVQTDPSRDDYLFLSTQIGSQTWPYSYVDSGSNGLFFDDATITGSCGGAGRGAAWYCPAAATHRTALLTDRIGQTQSLDLTVISADALFASANSAFGTLGGHTGSGAQQAFVWGLPVFFGRRVYTSIWGQALSSNGPWVVMAAP